MGIIDHISGHFIVYQVLFLVAICRQWCYYFGDEARSGQTIYKIRKPGLFIAASAVLYIALLFLCIYGIWAGETKEKMYFILFFAEFIVGFFIDYLPQPICENGIRTSQGFVPWSSIYKVRNSEKKYAIMIEVHGKKRAKKIYCQPEEKGQLEKFILERARTQQGAGASALEQEKSGVNES